MKLYATDERVLNAFDWNTGEVVDEELLNILTSDDTDAKEHAKWVEQVAMEYKNLMSDADQLALEEAQLKDRRVRIEAKAKRLEDLVSAALNGSEFKTPTVLVKFTPSHVTECDADFVEWAKEHNTDLLRYKEPEPDKVAIKEYLKEFPKAKIPARIVDRLSMKIK